MQKVNKEIYSITGNFVTVVEDHIQQSYGTLYIREGIICAIETTDTPRTQDIDCIRNQCSFSITLSDDDIIYPGLIDLHTHYQYNMLPIWKRPQETPWDNRFEWRNHSTYIQAIPTLEKKISENWNRMLPSGKNTMGDLFLFFSELQAIAGGTTVLQEPSVSNPSIEPQPASYCYSFAEDTHSHLLIRSTGNAKDLGINISADDQIFSIVDFFTPIPREKTMNVTPHISTQDWQIQVNTKYQDFLSKLQSAPKNYNAYLVHVAEGRSGNLRPDNLNVDAYTAKEFEQLKTDMEKKMAKNKKGLPDNFHFAIIHGCGINLSMKNHYDFLKNNGIGLIWSPVSNLLLYDDTPAFYENIINNDITLSIGSDWSPSGSKYVWDEGKFAYKYLESRSKSMHIMSDIFKMMTINPAKTLGSKKIGCITPGAFADLFIISKPRLNCEGATIQRNDSEACLTPLFRGTDAQTKLVIIGGHVIYGEETYFKQFEIPYQKLPSDEHSAFHKVVYVPEELEIDLEKDTQALDEILTDSGTIRSKFLAADDIEYRENIVSLRRKFIGELQLDVLPSTNNTLRLGSKNALIHTKTGQKIKKGENLISYFLTSQHLHLKEVIAETENTLLLTFDAIPNAGDCVLLLEENLCSTMEKSNPYALVFTFTGFWSEW